MTNKLNHPPLIFALGPVVLSQPIVINSTLFASSEAAVCHTWGPIVNMRLNMMLMSLSCLFLLPLCEGFNSRGGGSQFVYIKGFDFNTFAIWWFPFEGGIVIVLINNENYLCLILWHRKSYLFSPLTHLMVEKILLNYGEYNVIYTSSSLLYVNVSGGLQIYRQQKTQAHTQTHTATTTSSSSKYQQ